MGASSIPTQYAKSTANPAAEHFDDASRPIATTLVGNHTEPVSANAHRAPSTATAAATASGIAHTDGRHESSAREPSTASRADLDIFHRPANIHIVVVHQSSTAARTSTTAFVTVPCAQCVSATVCPELWHRRPLCRLYIHISSIGRTDAVAAASIALHTPAATSTHAAARQQYGPRQFGPAPCARSTVDSCVAVDSCSRGRRSHAFLVANDSGIHRSTDIHIDGKSAIPNGSDTSACATADGHTAS